MLTLQAALRERKAPKDELVKVEGASAPVGILEREAEMAIRYGCFFSYAHGRYELMNKFKAALSDAIRCSL